ncbi:MAG: nucleotidyltransferase domain-containing protein [Patescibacteria group bacterium]|nr:nucleotidyltransferase domain-containing protein [Patescibacteria group bacterium]
MSFNLTKNQSLLLGLFFANPKKSFYMRQLSRMIDKEPGVFQKDINNLEDEGILKSNYVGNNRFFSLNKNYPLFKEIKSIINKTTGLEKTLEKSLQEIKNIDKAYIYGSYAKGESDKFSDIDLLIIGYPVSDKLENVIKQLEKRFRREINYTLYSQKEFNQKKNKDPFLKDIMNDKKIEII